MEFLISRNFFIHLTGVENEEVLKYEFTTHDIVTLTLSTAVGVWYLMKKHWIANNLFGLAFAVNGVELLHLNNVMTGCILLGGLFLYDIFWVFGTDVVSIYSTMLDFFFYRVSHMDNSG